MLKWVSGTWGVLQNMWKQSCIKPFVVPEGAAQRPNASSDCTYLLNVSASTSCWDISVWTEVAGPWNQLEFCNFSHWTSSLHIFLSVTYHCIIIRFKYVLFFLYLPREVMFLVKFLGFVNRITGTLQAQIHFWIQMKRTSDNRTGSSLFIHMTQTAVDRDGDKVFSLITV